MDGTPFGRYRLVELLGRGGMGEVWRAYDTGTDRVVAVKVLPPHFAQDPTFAERFRREAHAAAKLSNAHVVPIHDYGEIDGRLFVDMRLIEGHDLQEELGSGPMDPARVVDIVDQIAKALNSAHRTGLIHRDVKPSNILLDEDDIAYLIDFGIARAASDTGLTNTGTTIGTWAYMAPERFSTNAIDARTDVYALTCVLHQCLTGATPYPGGSLEQIIAGHLTRPPPRPSAQNASVPMAFDDVIAAGLAKDPDNRYATTKELAAAARAALTAIVPPQSESSSRPTRLAPIPSPSAPTQHRLQPRPPEPRRPALPPSPHIPNFRQQETLPFASLSSSCALAADGSGTVYVADWGNNRVLALTAGSAAPTTLPFDRLKRPCGIAVDDAGSVVYVSDLHNHRVVALSVGTSTQRTVPFTDLGGPKGLDVSHYGTVHVTDITKDRVLALAAGSTTHTTLPFTDLRYPAGIAVDDFGAIYVTDFDNDRVVALGGRFATQITLPFTGLSHPYGIGVDAVGIVYITDYSNNRVIGLAPGSNRQVVLPFAGLNLPQGVAVDRAGNVYVADRFNDSGRVLKLPVL